MPRRPPRHRPPVLVLVAALLLLVLGAGPVLADDIYEIDGRLQDAGFAAAYTETYEAYDVSGFRVAVDFASESETRAGYDREALEIARLVWLHLEGRVLAVDIAPLTTTLWTGDALPPAVSFSREDLQQAYGPRSSALDRADTRDEVSPVLAIGVGIYVLVVAAVLVGATVAIVRTHRRPARTPGWGGYGDPQAQWSAAPGAWGAPGGQAAPTWGQPQSGPEDDLWRAPPAR